MSTDCGLQKCGGIVILLLLFLSSCSDRVPQELQVSNYGGAGRDWYWPDVNLSAFEWFDEVDIDSLEGGFLGPQLPLGNYDFVSLTTGQRLVLIRHNRLQWSTPIREGLTFMPQLASDARGHIYIQSTNAELFAVDTGGQVLWESQSVMVEEGSFGLPLYPLALEDLIVVGNTEGMIAGISPEGKELWTIINPTKLTRYLASAGERGIVVGGTHNSGEGIDTVSMISRDGAIVWNRSVDGRIEVGPICSGDRIVVGVSSRSEDGKYRPELALYDAVSGDELWRRPLRELPRNMAIDSEGNVYVSGGGGAKLSGGVVASFSPEGDKRWETGFRQSVPTTLLIAGNIYIVAHQGRSLGIYCYTLDGGFLKYAPIDTPLRLALPPTILPTGSMVIGIREEGKMLRGN